MKSIKETWKDNPWKVSTIIIIGLILLLVINIIYGIYKEQSEENQRICSMIEATPAWVDSNGFLVGYGLIAINQSNEGFANNLTNTLMKNKIKFVYNSYCSACLLQIQIFGEQNFDKLRQKGLTLDCAK